MMRLQNYVNGAAVDSTSSMTTTLFDPATGSPFATAPQSNAADVDAAMKAAAKAFESFKETTPSERQMMLLKIADALEANKELIAATECRNCGKPKQLFLDEELAVMCDQIRFFAGACRILEGKSAGMYMKDMMSFVIREPIGVCAAVTPWNYPLMMAVWKFAPAIAAGNVMVLKPSDTTPASTLLAARIMGEILPPGVFNVVCGERETGTLLTAHPIPSMVSITGSVKAGKEVAAAAVPTLKRVHLELGGKAPVVVFADANLAAAAEGIAVAGYFNAGQDCTAATRVIVEESVYEDFVSLLAEQASSKTKVGSATTMDDEDVLVGPLNNAAQFERVRAMLARVPTHARIVAGGKAVQGPGFFLQPTVVAGLKQEDEMIQQEIFGPVITVQPFRDEAAAIKMANGVEYGLASSVWSKDHARALRCSRAFDFGCVWINTHIPLVAEMPHGGFKQSGYGKDLSAYGFEEYTRVKHVMSAL
jgi:betaine-aldehyde dehydrogenase